MIRSKKDYIDYLKADGVALGRNKLGIFDKVTCLIAPDYIWDFQRLLRNAEYYKNVKKSGISEAEVQKAVCEIMFHHT